jgi:hypothetical protein
MTTLYECDIVTSRQANNAHTAPAWLWWAAMLALVGAIMVPLCKRLGAGRVIVSLNTGFMAGLGVVVLVKLGMNTYYRSASFTLDRDEQMDWVLRDSRLAVAATSLVLVGILMASAFMASTLPRNEASRNGVSPGSMSTPKGIFANPRFQNVLQGRKIFIILLIISAIALACVDLAQDALVMALNMDRLNMPRDYMTSLQALYFLAYFTYLMTAIAAILLATSFTDDSTSAYPAAYPAVYAAAAPEPKYGYQTEAYPPPQPQYSYAAPQPQYTYSAPQPPYNTAASPPPLAHTQPVR